ncbi:MAG: RnfABCDGE type electron transport complex subunit D [Nitrospinae bacterium]|nr:RnfABCDGE type electron transport complex subunit D [Nitrospinota bacterium]
MEKDKKTSLLLLTPAPHIRAEESVRELMFSVIIALIPAALAGVYFFGLQAILTLCIAATSSILFEFAYQRMTGSKNTVSDGSAALTGLLLGLNLPAGFPWWGTIAGSFIAVILVKHLFGGLGFNIFNPALAARVFLLISWPLQMSTFPKPAPIFSGIDAVTAATPLTVVKTLQLSHDLTKSVESVTEINWFDLLIGNRGGSIGEVSTIALLIGGIYLIYKKTIVWHTPVSFILTTTIFSTIFYLINPKMAANPVFHLLNGGLFLGAFFMSTDYVTSPITKRGMLIFGAGCGFLTALIRQYGSYPEGVSFAILLMNMTVPLLDKYLRPRKFGG